PEAIQAVRKAQDDSNWHMMLHQLRVSAPLLSPFQLASLRAAAWDHMHQPRIASVFYDYAVALEPSNGQVAWMALRALEQADPMAAQARAQAVLQDPYRQPVAVVVLSASMLLRKADLDGQPIDHPRY